MQRADTTARKWNASRPTYDEDWSDDDYGADEEKPRSYERNIPILHQKILKAPWEARSEEDLGSVTNDTAVASGPDQAVNAPTTVPADVHPISLKTAGTKSIMGNQPAEYLRQAESISHTVPATSATNSKVNTQVAAKPVTLIPTVDQPVQARLLTRSPSPVSELNREEDTLVAKPLIVVEDTTKDAAHDLHKSIEPPSGRALETSHSSNSLFTDDEDMRLQALMFKPENLPVNDYSDDESQLSTEIVQAVGIPDLPEPGHARNDLTEKSKQPVSMDIPSYPTDFRDGLKSRALSDAILETMHSPAPDRAKSVSAEDLTVHAAVTAERTPSILLTTSTWAEKNRVLKEQLEKNKRLKEELQNTAAANVRASTYDHEYEYQPSLPKAVESRSQYNEKVEMQHPTPPNLGTLVEEEEDETSKPKLQGLRQYSPTRQESDIPRPATSTTFEKTAARKSVDASSVNSGRRLDVHKSLPPVHDSARTSSASSHSSGTSGSDEQDSLDGEDTALTAEQEYALVQQYQASPEKLTSDHEIKDLPPILQVAEQAKRSSLPSIQTQSADQAAVQRAEYTPSIYSAHPSTAGTNLDEIDARRDASFQVVPALENVTEEHLPRSDQPLSKSWEPLKASSRTSVQSPVYAAETSRFSTSTTQSADADEYRFDMRDTFNPAMLGTLEDNPYSDDEEPDAEEINLAEASRSENPQQQLKGSASVATLQPPLRHMESHIVPVQDSRPELMQDEPRTTESERLADELLQQLSNTGTGRGLDAENPRTPRMSLVSDHHQLNSPRDTISRTEEASVLGSAASPAVVVKPEDEPLDRMATGASGEGMERSERTFGRARSSSTGSKFLEVMSPMTSMDQQRISQPASHETYAVQSANLMRYKDIKQLSSRSERTAEYARRTRAIQESSNGLRTYLLEVQARLRENGRDLPGPVVHVEFKASKSIIPDKFVPHDLSRTTVRLGDRSKDAAKGLLSKSTKGFKGLFHSNSRSVSHGSHKPSISAPMESNGPNRTASMIGVTKSPTSTQRSVSTPQGPQLVAPVELFSAQHVNSHGPRLTSPISQSSTYEGSGTARSPNRPMHHALTSSPPPQSPAYSEVDPTISRIQSYFPGISMSEIERALDACDRDEQRAMGYLVVNRGH